MSNKIIIVKPKAITAKDRKLLQEKGFIVIQSDMPDGIKIINELDLLDTNDLLYSALNTLLSGNESHKYLGWFGKELIERIKKKEKNTTKMV